jgi:hypothetical protein
LGWLRLGLISPEPNHFSASCVGLNIWVHSLFGRKNILHPGLVILDCEFEAIDSLAKIAYLDNKK